MILAGDIGGTKTNLGLFDEQQGKLVRVADKRYASREYPGLLEAVTDFLRENPAKITSASFGIAGPVVNNAVHATNLPWVVDGAALSKHLGLDHVWLLNDLEAHAYGIGLMEPSDLLTLNPGVSAPQAPRAVIAAGTGLGEAILFWDGKQHLALATEAGHADFAPSTEQQGELWKFLKARQEFVSVEIVLAGSGFQRIHEFLDPALRHPDFDPTGADSGPGITERGLSGKCAVCAATLNLWVEIYGSEAGNLAVRTVARGGVYVSGGIAAKILPKLKSDRFVSAATRKEKMQAFMAKIPIHVVLNEELPLIGAAYIAWKRG
jgi:glucokinase